VVDAGKDLVGGGAGRRPELLAAGTAAAEVWEGTLAPVCACRWGKRFGLGLVCSVAFARN
jgi:hypothetical protein